MKGEKAAFLEKHAANLVDRGVAVFVDSADMQKTKSQELDRSSQNLQALMRPNRTANIKPPKPRKRGKPSTKK